MKAEDAALVVSLVAGKGHSTPGVGTGLASNRKTMFPVCLTRYQAGPVWGRCDGGIRKAAREILVWLQRFKQDGNT